MPIRPFPPLVAAAALGLVLAAPPAARAAPDDVDELGQRMVELEAQVRELDITLKSEGPQGDSVERRVIDGQVLYELKNYEAASIILLDVVDHHPGDRSWPEALFYLADSLFLKRDFLSARRYFERSVSLGAGSRRYQDSLERLIEIAVYTKDDANVDDYLTRLESLGKTTAPNVAYVEGKYQFFRERYDQAATRLSSIQKGQAYYFQAQYLLGAIRVAQAQPGDAVLVFDALTKVEPKADGDKQVVDLARMALGRVYYDQGQLTAAAVEYSKIPQGSELYTESLNETAWVSIKDRQFAKAYRDLELLLTVKPDGPQTPEIKLLMSKLQVRQQQWEEATRSFTGTRDEFEVIKKDLDEALRKQGDSEAFFRDLLAKNLGKFDLAAYVPDSATRWVTQEPDLEKLSNLIGDETDLRKSLDESAELIAKLEKAIDGPARVNIFPELAAARTRSLLTGNRLVDLENRLIQKEHDLVVRAVGSVDAAPLEQATAARQQIQKDLASLPRVKDAYEDRMKVARGGFDEVDKQAVEVNVYLSNLVAERVAIEKYVADTHQAEDQATRQSLARQLDEIKRTESELTATYDQLRKEITDSEQSVGVDDAQMQAEAALKTQLAAAQKTEIESMSALGGRLPPADRSKAEQIEALLGRSHAAQALIVDFNGKIDGLIDQKLKDMRQTITDEKVHLVDYQKSLGGYRGETNDVGGGVTALSFRNIVERFYQIVVQADVGIIDVAWALKQSKTDENSRLVREKKRELKMLDDQFREVLRE